MASSAIQRRSVSWRAPGSRPAASPARTSAARSRVPRQAGSLSTFRSAPIVPMLSAGFIGSNAGTISNSHATGAVLGLRQAGGFAGDNHGGTITSSTATGPVTGIDNALPSERRGGYADTAAALEGDVLAAIRAGDAVMVKGSLGSRMGPLVKALKRRYAQSGEQG